MAETLPVRAHKEVRKILDTVLGLSVTPTTVGWVLAEGHGADGAILDHCELELHDRSANTGNVRAVIDAERVTDEVLRAREVATSGDRRLRVIGVTWTDEAAAQAALLLEALTDAGLDNVVPVRLLDSVETLAQAIAPVIGYERTAVCILEQEWATVVMVDTRDGQTQTAVKHVRGGFGGLTSWLTGMFDRSTWRPSGVVVVGSERDVSDFSWQLEKVLPVPVFAQTMAQVTVARGAALAAAQSTEFTDADLFASTSQIVEPTPARGSRKYAAAAAALSAAAVTFVVSASLALGLELTPTRDAAPTPHVHNSPPPVAEAAAPVTAPPPPTQREPVRLTAGEAVDESAPAEPSNGLAPQPGLPNGPLRLSRVLEHIPGSYADSATQPPE